jgi:Tol biopolymer transport system component
VTAATPVRIALIALSLVGSMAASPAPVQSQASNFQGRIAFTSRRNGIDEIYVIADGKTNKLAAGSAPAWSSGGERIAYVAEFNLHDQIFIMQADGSDPVKVTQVTTSAAAPAWSPDGQRLAFVSLDDGHPEVYVIGADGSNPTRLTTNFGSSPAWSPDGKTIAYVSTGEIYLVGLDGANPVRITNNHRMLMGTGADDLAWSPDGKTIAFSYYIDAHDAIYRVNADGSNLVRLTGTGDINNRSPAWSPDGASIAYCSYDQSSEDIFVMNADGSNPTRLTRGYVAYQPTWTSGR